MSNRINYFKLLRYCLIFLLVILFCGCMKRELHKTEYKSSPIEAEKIIFFGFKPAISQGKESDLFHNPVSDAEVRAEPVSEFVTNRMSGEMYALLVESKDCEIINFSEIKHLADPALFEDGRSGEINKIQTIGKAFSADVAITGYLYRMRERKGTELAINSPDAAAYASFEIFLISVKDGSILWKEKFDQTQRALNENLLEFKSFLKFKGKWVDVDTLIKFGLKEMADKIPLKNK